MAEKEQTKRLVIVMLEKDLRDIKSRAAKKGETLKRWVIKALAQAAAIEDRYR